ncbi:ParA family protein [Pseudomonas sp. NPDC096950]|uniref:ParA family protein n=1 Tax=Pseudomonas sp. NPDC096950 TaxID=3364485 RepID=UPI00383BEFF2
MSVLIPFYPHPVVPVIISFNYKGGVGKTTTSRVLAQGVADLPELNKGKPILIVDLDPQANTTRRWQLHRINEDGSLVPKDHPALMEDDVKHSSICDLWLDVIGVREKPLVPVPYETSNPLIHVIPAHEELMAEVMRVPRDEVVKLGRNMRKWLRDPALAEQYCAVVLDTQPSKSSLIDAALASATHAYIPFVPEPQSVDGVMSMIMYAGRYIKERREQQNDVPLRLVGLLPNMVQRTRLHNQHIKIIRDHEVFSKYLMPVKLHKLIGYAETDDWRNSPDQVTALDNTNIALEAKKFVKYLWNDVMQDAEILGGGA